MFGFGGFSGVPGGPGMPGGGVGAAPPGLGNYTMNNDDYVTAVVEVKNLQPYPAGTRYRRESIGGQFHFNTKWGTTHVDVSPNQSEIIVDHKNLPTPLRQLENKRKVMKNTSPEKMIDLADWCLSVGLPDEAIKILEGVSENPGNAELTPTAKKVIDAFKSVKDSITANIPNSDKANVWKERIGYPIVSVSKHYAIIHKDGQHDQDSANRRLDYLEMNLKTFYTWFAIRGKALPAPTEKLVAILVGDTVEFRNYQNTFEATNLSTDSFFARRENIAVFSARRLDKASVNFDQLKADAYRKKWSTDYFNAKLPDQRDKGGPTYGEFARGSAIALVNHALEQESEISAATHEGSKQLFAETGLLPRTVLAPDWVRFGLASLFEMPKGPFPGGAGQVKVAFYPGGGGPNWAYMRYYEEMKEKGLLKSMERVFLQTLTDANFKLARDVRKLSTSKFNESQSKTETAEQLYDRARTLSWALTYFLAKNHFPEFEAFLQELSKLPRDAELDPYSIMVAFATAFQVDTTHIDSKDIDPANFLSIAQGWRAFMDRQQSPSRQLKVDALAITPPGSTPGGMPGMPGGFPGGPGGFPGGPGGVPGGPGGPGGGRGGDGR
jgi:hypothetical protein